MDGEEVGTGGPGEDGRTDVVTKAIIAAVKGEPTIVSENKTPNEEHCMVILEVSTTGPAAHLGLQHGDLIVSIDSVAASKVLAPQCCSSISLPRGEHVFECYFRAVNQLRSFEIADGIALGTTVQPTLAAAKGLLFADPSNWDLLYILWQKGEWRWLLHFSSLATGLSSWNDDVANPQWRLPCIPYTSTLVRRLTLQCIMSYSEHRLNSPALVMQGAAMLELGMLDNGALFVATFYEQYEDDHTTNFQAVARLYLAKVIAAERGRSEDGSAPLDEGDACRGLLEDAVELFGADSEALRHVNRVSEHINAGLLVDPSSAAPQNLPPPPSIPTPEWGALRGLPGSTWDVSSLASVLQGMQAPQLAAVVLLGGYRCNGPYNELMADLSVLGRGLGPAGLWAGVVVVTQHGAPEGGGSGARRHWLENEERMKGEGGRCCVLQATAAEYRGWEENVEAALGVEVAVSPVLLLLAADGSARYISDVERVQVEVWNELGRAGGVAQLTQE